MGRFDPDAMPPWIASLDPEGNRPPWVVAGVNEDDCAVLQWSEPLVVATIDFLNARPIALQLGIASMWDLGRLVFAANLSDLCGSGARPVAFLVGAMLARDSEEEDFRALMEGVQFEARRWEVPIVGGDSKLGDATAILGVAIGTARSPDNLFLQNRARTGDIVWVSGSLGSCSAATVGLDAGIMPEEWDTWAREAILVPQLPITRSRALSECGFGRGGVDISDGLGADLRDLCLASGVGIVIDAASIPVEPEVSRLAAAIDVPAWAFAFGSGGDFQFAVTTPAEQRERVAFLGFTEIGQIIDAPDYTLNLPGGKQVRMPTVGHRDARDMGFAAEIRAIVDQMISDEAEGL